MLTSSVLLSLVLHLVPPASSAEISTKSSVELQNAIKARKTAGSPENPAGTDAPDDQISDLFMEPGPGKAASERPQAPPSPSPAQKRPVPTYESWDVLRQYPRYDVLQQPSAPATTPEQKEHPPKDEAKEKDDD